jgi:hypothetical protein
VGYKPLGTTAKCKQFLARHKEHAPSRDAHLRLFSLVQSGKQSFNLSSVTIHVIEPMATSACIVQTTDTPLSNDIKISSEAQEQVFTWHRSARKEMLNDQHSAFGCSALNETCSII